MIRSCWSASEASCVTVTIVDPKSWFRLKSRAMILDLFAESRAAAGSSARTTPGFIMTARTKTVPAFLPPEHLSGFAKYRPNAQRVHHLAESFEMLPAKCPCAKRGSLMLPAILKELMNADPCRTDLISWLLHAADSSSFYKDHPALSPCKRTIRANSPSAAISSWGEPCSTTCPWSRTTILSACSTVRIR